MCAKLGKLEDVKKHCDDALKVDEKSFKALMRRGMNYVQLKNFDAGEADYKAAAAIQPDSTSARQPLSHAVGTQLQHRPLPVLSYQACCCYHSRIKPDRTSGGQR